MKTKTLIKCPHCGAEYLPGEIFYPKDFLGKPENIIKDDEGIILGFDGSDMDLTETFICEKCEKEFNIEATVSFKTSPAVELFEEDF